MIFNYNPSVSLTAASSLYTREPLKRLTSAIFVSFQWREQAPLPKKYSTERKKRSADNGAPLKDHLRIPGLFLKISNPHINNKILPTNSNIV